MSPLRSFIVLNSVNYLGILIPNKLISPDSKILIFILLWADSQQKTEKGKGSSFRYLLIQFTQRIGVYTAQPDWLLSLFPKSAQHIPPFSLHSFFSSLPPYGYGHVLASPPSMGAGNHGNPCMVPGLRPTAILVTFPILTCSVSVGAVFQHSSLTVNLKGNIVPFPCESLQSLACHLVHT